MRNSGYTVDVLLRKRQHLGQEIVLVVILDVVDSTHSRNVLVGCFLDFVQDLFVFKVSFPVEHVVVVFFIEVTREVSALQHALNARGVAIAFTV